MMDYWYLLCFILVKYVILYNMETTNGLGFGQRPEYEWLSFINTKLYPLNNIWLPTVSTFEMEKLVMLNTF